LTSLHCIQNFIFNEFSEHLWESISSYLEWRALICCIEIYTCHTVVIGPTCRPTRNHVSG